MSIKVNLEPLESAATFPYLGFTIGYNNSDWVALYHNLFKARRWWGMVLNVLENIGAKVRSR